MQKNKIEENASTKEEITQNINEIQKNIKKETSTQLIILNQMIKQGIK